MTEVAARLAALHPGWFQLCAFVVSRAFRNEGTRTNAIEEPLFENF